MAMRIAQLAFDRLISDVGIAVLKSPIDPAHEDLLRSSFQKEVSRLISSATTLTHDEQSAIVEKAQAIFRYHCWVNQLDPRWELVCTRMIKHLNDVQAMATLGHTTDPNSWAPPRPRGTHVKGERVPCTLCGENTVAPLDHLAYNHGIDIQKNRYVTREAHMVKMCTDVLIQHLIQDGGELNRLQGEIGIVERKLERLNVGYQSMHGLPLDLVYELDRAHPSFVMSRQLGQSKKTLVNNLIDLRKAGLKKGRLSSREGGGTYSEVLADLRGVLHRVEESLEMARWDWEGWRDAGDKGSM